MSLFTKEKIFLGGSSFLSGFLAYLGVGIAPMSLLPFIQLPLLLYLIRATDLLYNLFLFTFLAIGSSFSFYDSSSSPLDSPFDNIIVLALIGLVISTMTILPGYLEKEILKTYPHLVRNSFFLFPLLWTTTWFVYRLVSPLGSLGEWVYPIQGTGDSIIQIASIFGISGIDFFLSCWANFVTQLIVEITSPEDENRDDELDERTTLLSTTRHQARLRVAQRAVRRRKLMAIIFFAGIYLYGATRLNQIEEETVPETFKVACALSTSQIDGSPEKEIIKLTKYLTTEAKIVLWSESAVHYDSTVELDRMLAEVKNISHQHRSYVGVAYTVPASTGGKRKNVLSLIGPSGPNEPNGTILFNYTKSYPVPIAESYSTEAGPGILPNERIEILEKGRPAIPVDVSAAICFDMDFPSLLKQAGKANLVLSPAQTWSTGIGFQHFRMASVRAIEQGFWLLRCDAGGVSGLVDNFGRTRDWQANKRNGTNGYIWYLPLNEKNPTIYSTYGEKCTALLLGFALLWVVLKEDWVQPVEDGVDRKLNQYYQGIIDMLPRDLENHPV